MAKDQAALDNARVDQTRYETLLKQNAIPEQTVATQKALVDQDIGTVKTDQGQIDSAKLNLVYCRITAPITGRLALSGNSHSRGGVEKSWGPGPATHAARGRAGCRA